MLSKAASSTIFWVFGMTQPGIEPRSPGPLANSYLKLYNLRINFYLLQTFCPHLGSFCVVSSFTTFRPNFTSDLLQVILPRPRIGMLSLVTVSPVITAFHRCCLSHHVFDQINLWPAWEGFETAIFWQCSPGTVETQRLYPLRHGPRNYIIVYKSIVLEYTWYHVSVQTND